MVTDHIFVSVLATSPAWSIHVASFSLPPEIDCGSWQRQGQWCRGNWAFQSGRNRGLIFSTFTNVYMMIKGTVLLLVYMYNCAILLCIFIYIIKYRILPRQKLSKYYFALCMLYVCMCTSNSDSSNWDSCIFLSSSCCSSLVFSVSSSGFSCWMVKASS